MMNKLGMVQMSFISNHSDSSLLDISATLTPDEMPPWGYMLAAVTLFLIGFFGFFLNLFVIVLMCKDNQIWTPMNIILLNLVCSDFSVSIIGNPVTLTAAINHGWMFGDVICTCYGFFMALLGIASIATLTVLAYERHCLVNRPFSTSHLTKRGARIAVVLIWLYSFCVTSPPLFGWGKYVSEAANISCSVNWETQSYNATSYIMFLFAFGLFIPVIVITYSYCSIIKTMRESNLRAGRVNKLESRVTSMIFVMIVAFLVAWTPYSIFALCEQFGDPDIITTSLAILPALIAKSSICYNPLIYVGMNPQFRAAWRRVCGDDDNRTMANETQINHISETSCRDQVECAVLNPKKKQKLRKTRIILKTQIFKMDVKKIEISSAKKVKNGSQDVNGGKEADLSCNDNLEGQSACSQDGSEV